MKLYRVVVITITAIWIGACATQRPVFYPNATLQQRGESMAEQDIDACMEYARVQGIENEQAGRIASSTAKRGAAGGAAGAVGGAIAGHAGRGAAIGSATAATWGLMQGLFSSSAPDPLFRSFVNVCLQNRGYQLIGWR
jgi:outer membrane lipoprotein SlyB